MYCPSAQMLISVSILGEALQLPKHHVEAINIPIFLQWLPCPCSHLVALGDEEEREAVGFQQRQMRLALWDPRGSGRQRTGSGKRKRWAFVMTTPETNFVSLWCLRFLYFRFSQV